MLRVSCFSSLLVVFVLLTLPASAQSVTGRVVDADAQPLAGASVVLREARSGQLRYGTAADAGGAYRFARVQPGRYRLEASFVGFAPAAVPLTVTERETVERRIVLSAQAVPQEEVVVTATRAEKHLNPITFSNLTARELEALPAMKDLPVGLATLPSITTYSENGNGIGYSTLRLRGFDQRRVAVAINGIPQNDPEDFNVFWINFFDIQGAVQDVQVQRGAGSAFYGPTAIGGAINIVAAPYRPDAYATVEVGLGAFGTQRYTAEANSGLLADRYVAFARGSRLLSDGYRDGAWTEFWRFFAGVTRFGDRSTVTLQAYGGPQEDGLAFSGIPRAANDATVTDAFGSPVDRRYNPSAFTGDTESFHQPHIELLHDWQLGDRLTLHQAVFGIKGEGYFDFGATFRSADYLRLPAGWRGLSPAERTLPLFLTAPDVPLLFRAYLDQWQVGWLPRLEIAHRRGTTTIGAEARLHRSLRWGRIQEATGVPDGVVGSANDVRVYSVRGEKAIASVYGSHLARPHERLAVQADVQLTARRYRVYDEAFFATDFSTPFVFVNPRLGVTGNPERPVSAYASVAYASREPRLKTLYDGEEAGAGFRPQFEVDATGAFDFDAPLVRPEHVLNVELGTGVTRTRWRLSVGGYLMDFRDEIVPSGGLDQFGVPRTGNADRTRHLGLEAEGQVWVSRGLVLYGNAAVSRNRFVRFTEFAAGPAGPLALERDGNPIAGFPERVANGGATYRWRGLTTTLTAQFAGRQYIDNSEATNPDGTPNPDLTVDAYTLVNATARYAAPRGPLRGLEVGLDVNNVLDRRVLLFGNVGPLGPQFFPSATRHAFAFVRYTVR